MKASIRAMVFAIVLAFFSNPGPADETASNKAPRKPVKLPGMVIDFEKRCIDLEATICLDKGFLELVACTKASKEHESIVAVAARPMHIHTALLLLGATNGNPAMRKPVDKEETRWVHLPPRGDPIEVFLVFNNSDGEIVERSVSDFIIRSEERADESSENFPPAKPTGKPEANSADTEDEFPNTFLFAGSHLLDAEQGPRQYLADRSGNVISIATFGDELLCLPFEQSHENGALEWQVDSTHLPNVGAEVTLRLRPKHIQHNGVKE